MNIKNILLVDDDESFNDILQKRICLLDKTICIDVALTVNQANMFISKKEYDLLFIDLNLTGELDDTSGIGVANNWRQTHNFFYPAILSIITGNHLDGFKKEVGELNPDNFFDKIDFMLHFLDIMKIFDNKFVLKKELYEENYKYKNKISEIINNLIINSSDPIGFYNLEDKTMFLNQSAESLFHIREKDGENILKKIIDIFETYKKNVNNYDMSLINDLDCKIITLNKNVMLMLFYYKHKHIEELEKNLLLLLNKI